MTKPLHLLVVEDDHAIRTMMERALTTHHTFTGEYVRDGDEAIRCLEAGKRYDVIVLDIMTPKRNGFDVLDYMQQASPAQIGQTIIVTAGGYGGFERYDVHDVIEKPFDLAKLKATISACASKRAA